MIDRISALTIIYEIFSLLRLFPFAVVVSVDDAIVIPIDYAICSILLFCFQFSSLNVELTNGLHFVFCTNSSIFQIVIEFFLSPIKTQSIDEASLSQIS